MIWTERTIGAWLARWLFNRQYLLVCPNTRWTGHECDILGIDPKLRVVDIEIKISRADLKADAGKDKWWHARQWVRREAEPTRQPRQWPPRVWKHYYCLPEAVWKDELIDTIPKVSGVLLLLQKPEKYPPHIRVHRRCRPCRDAKPIDAADAIDIARLASLRMWDAYDTCDQLAKRIQENKP